MHLSAMTYEQPSHQINQSDGFLDAHRARHVQGRLASAADRYSATASQEAWHNYRPGSSSTTTTTARGGKPGGKPGGFMDDGGAFFSGGHPILAADRAEIDYAIRHSIAVISRRGISAPMIDYHHNANARANAVTAANSASMPSLVRSSQ